MDTLRYYIGPLITSIAVVGFLIGGNYVWLGLVSFPFLLALDVALPPDLAERKVGSPIWLDIPLYLHLVLMIVLYAAFLSGVVAGSIVLSGPGSLSQVLGCIVTIGWFSAVPTTPVAHELSHRRHWFPRRFSLTVLATMSGDPNRDIGHVRTHHIYLGSSKDSDTAPRGQTIYEFMFRAARGGYVDALYWEAEALRRRGLSPWNWRNRAYQGLMLALALPGICWFVAGPMAMLVCLAAVLVAKLLLEGFNYFQHYGLVREVDGPLLQHHAWNHLGAVIRPLGVEITNHINHHYDAYTPYYKLKPEPGAPQMPSIFLCFILGLIPPLWFKYVAKPKLKEWDERYATPGERKLAMAANARAGWPQWLDKDGNVTA